MALRTNTRERLYQMHTYRQGRCDVLALRGFFHVVERVQGHGVRIPDLQITSSLSQSNTPTAIDAAGTGRVYFVWAQSGTQADAGLTATATTIVQVTDNDVVLASFPVTANNASEAYYYDYLDGVGFPYGTDLEVLAVTLAGGNPDAANQPDIVIVWGDNAINTEDANFLVSTYG